MLNCSFKTKLCVLALSSSLMLPAAASAATAGDSASQPAAPAFQTIFSVIQTNVNGVFIPGNFVINQDSRAVYAPGIGYIVVNKDTRLPPGSYYLKPASSVK